MGQSARKQETQEEHWPIGYIDLGLILFNACHCSVLRIDSQKGVLLTEEHHY